MKARELKKELIKKDVEVKQKILQISPKNIAQTTGFRQTDISDYSATPPRKNWSWKKILKIAEKLGL